jgi:hypothetical protein
MTRYIECALMPLLVLSAGWRGDGLDGQRLCVVCVVIV